MEREEKMNKSMIKNFSVLTAKNKKSVIEMTKFLVITQNNIVPEMLKKNGATLPIEAEKQGLA